MLISPNSALIKNFNPQNTNCMSVVKFFSRLEFEQIIYSVTTCQISTNLTINWSEIYTEYGVKKQ